MSSSAPPRPRSALPSSPSALRRVMESLPPSKEVLEVYRAKVRSFEEDERRWQRRLASARGMAARAAQAEKDKDEKEAELRALRGAIVEMEGAVAAERKRSAKLQAENDRLKISCTDVRRKVEILLRSTGRSEADLDRLISRVDEDEDAEAGSVLSEQLRRHIRDTKGRPARRGIQKTAGSLKLEIASLESQLLEQERCHLEQVSALENERRILRREQDQLLGQYEEKAGELARYIKTLDHGQEDLAKELEQVRGKFRRCEREWLSEKETLHRKLQLCRQFGTSSSSSADVLGAGFFTDQRSALRLGGDARLHKRLQQVNSELADQKAAAESYRNQLLTMEAEMDTLREQNDAGKKALQKRTKSMAEHIETLRERNEALERRKRVEAEGYHSDVKLLQRKIKQVEQQLLGAAVAKSKEHDYIKALKAYDRELEKLRTMMKKSPEWIS